MLCEEALLWRQLDHPYILPFLGIDAETFASRDALSLVSPWMELGTLKKYISSSSYNTARCGVRLVRNSSRFPHLFRRSIRQLFETAQGIQYLHEQQLVHGDINWVSGSRAPLARNLTKQP
jgi:serine/threonine protein kinase